MKWILIHILSCSFIVLNGQSQEAYNIDVVNTPIKDIIKTIESNHDLYFSYKEEDLEHTSITLKIRTSDSGIFLKALFQNTQLKYELVEEKYVILTKSEVSLQSPKSEKTKICGIILDSISGEPLPFANILLVGSDTGTSSDNEGNFELLVETNLEQHLQISYIGYHSKDIRTSTFIKNECQTIQLSYSEGDDLFIVIKDYIADGVTLTQNGLSTKLSPKKIGALPGQIEPDVMSTLQFIPGINSATSKASDIYIRGCTPDQNLLIWEDIPIYHSAHYFGMISAFNPYIIDDMNVFRGGFGAEYGGRIAGVVDLSSPDEKSSSSFYGIGTNMTHAYGYGKHQFSNRNPSALTFSLRRSYSELLKTPTFDNITKFNQQGLLLGSTEIAALPDNIRIEDDFNFIDTHLKYSSRLGSKDRIELAGLFADNSFSDTITDDNIGQTQVDDMTLMNVGVSANWQHQWSQVISTELKILGTSYDYAYDYNLEEERSSRSRISGSRSNMIQDKQVQLSTTYHTEKGQEINGGYHLINYNIDFNVDERSRRGQDIRDQGSSSSNLHSFYIIAKNPISKRIGYNAGLRASYYETSDQLYLEPRINIGYQLSDEISLHANYGKHHQFVSQITEFRGNNNGISTPLWALAENISVPVQVADIFQIGGIYQKENWVIDLQAFKRNIDGLSSRAYEFEEVAEGNPVIGTANIIGIDLLVKKRFNKFRSWLSYSLSKTDLSFREILPVSFSADYDQRHSLQWSNQIDFSKLKLALGLKASSGLPYSNLTGFEVTSRPNEALEYNAFYDGINRNTLPNQYEFNLTASYDIRPKNASWVGHFSFSLTNILNKENIFNRTFYVNAANDRMPVIRNIEKINLPLTPNLSFRMEW